MCGKLFVNIRFYDYIALKLICFRNKGESNSHKQLLALNTFDEWLGRRRPQLLENDSLGGEQTLRNILAASEMDDINESQNEKDVPGKYEWTNGVGEGRDDMGTLIYVAI